jgi:indolepyruvate ferredoxin oxidoreductase
VARLYVETGFLDRLQEQFATEGKVSVHLAPPLFAERDPETGQLKKRPYGAWVLSAFRLLARLKRLRGTPLDPFGYGADRRIERKLIRDYEAVVEELLQGLSPENHALAVEIAAIPEHIRGFGHVKARHLEPAKRREAELLALWRAPAPASAHLTAAE